MEFPNLVLSYHNFQETPENLMEMPIELTSLNPKVVESQLWLIQNKMYWI